MNHSSDQLVNDAKGTRSFGGVTNDTTVKDITGLLAPGSEGVNHGEKDTLWAWKGVS